MKKHRKVRTAKVREVQARRPRTSLGIVIGVVSLIGLAYLMYDAVPPRQGTAALGLLMLMAGVVEAAGRWVAAPDAWAGGAWTAGQVLFYAALIELAVYLGWALMRVWKEEGRSDDTLGD